MTTDLYACDPGCKWCEARAALSRRDEQDNNSSKGALP